MEIASFLRLFAMPLGVLFALVCQAQESTIEEWPGTLKRKGKQKESITLNVKITDEGPVILDMIYAGTSFEISQQKFGDDTLSFSWVPGEKPVECSLKLKDGVNYAGKCVSESSNNTIEMRIKPHKQEQQPSSNNDPDQGQANDEQQDE